MDWIITLHRKDYFKRKDNVVSMCLLRLGLTQQCGNADDKMISMVKCYIQFD